MAVICEAISVVARVDAIRTRYHGGLDAYLAAVPNATHCSDGQVSRVGFMAPADCGRWVDRLEKSGLQFVSPAGCIDFAVVDQLQGPTAPAPWLHFQRFPDGVSIAWVGELKLVDGRLAIACPDGWTPQQSADLAGGFRPTGNLGGLELLGHEDGVDVYLDHATGRQKYVGRIKEDEGETMTVDSRHRDRYGPNSQVVETFIRGLASLPADAWASTLAPWVCHPSHDPNIDPILSYRPGMNMPTTWDLAYLHADRVADPDRTKAWMTAVEDASKTVIEPALTGMLAFMASRSIDEYRAWAASLPGGQDPNVVIFVRMGKAPAEALEMGTRLRNTRDAQAAAQACLAMSSLAACALVVRDRILPEEFDLLYAPFAELIPATSRPVGSG